MVYWKRKIGFLSSDDSLYLEVAILGHTGFKNHHLGHV
jgi:hypothetical protein